MKPQNQNRRPLKILVVGSKGHSREVRCFGWTEIEKVPNIADHDAVIIDMTTLDKEILKKIGSNLPRYFMVDYFMKLFRSRGQVFVITVPTIEVEIPIRGRMQVFNNHWWNPFELKFEENEGDTIENVIDSFQRYISYVKHWYFTINFDRFPEPIEKLIKHFSTRHLVNEIVQSRCGDALGIQILLPNGARFCFLPKPTQISNKIAIDIILEDFLDIKTSEKEEPDWVKEMKIPGENEIETKIQKGINKIEKEKKEIEKLKQELQETIRFRKLLYAEDEELERIAWAIFRELGAKVIEPKEKNKEDGWAVTRFGLCVLEIKKASKSASRKHTRQLDNWVGNCIANSKKCKGILIINHYGDKPLEERKEPFPPDVRKHAKEARPGNPFCLLTTVELFNAFCAFRKREVSPNEIFKKIFEADGEECKLV